MIWDLTQVIICYKKNEKTPVQAEEELLPKNYLTCANITFFVNSKFQNLLSYLHFTAFERIFQLSGKRCTH